MNGRLQLALPDRNGSQSMLELTDFERFYMGRVLAEGGVRAHEPEVLAMTAALLDLQGGKGHFMDIGANIGIFALVMGKLFPAMQHTAFEPMPAMAEWLRGTANDNRLTIDVRQIALSDSVGTASFYVSKKSDTSNSLEARFRPYKEVIQVETATLDGLVEAGLPAPHTIKIDVESFEPSVLAGSRAVLEKHRPSIICEVLPDRTDKQIGEFFASLGYIGTLIRPDISWDMGQPVVGDTTYTYRDWLFLPSPPSDQLKTKFAEWLLAFERLPAPGRSARPSRPTSLFDQMYAKGRKVYRRIRKRIRG